MLGARCVCVQFTKDFVNDCRDLQYAFFFDPLRSPRLVDRLEEDIIHHASTLADCNARNVAFKLAAAAAAAHTSRSSLLIPKYTLDYAIAGSYTHNTTSMSPNCTIRRHAFSALTLLVVNFSHTDPASARVGVAQLL